MCNVTPIVYAGGDDYQPKKRISNQDAMGAEVRNFDHLS